MRSCAGWWCVMGALARGAGGGGRADQRRDRRARAGVQHRLRPGYARGAGRRAAVGAARRWCSSISPAAPASSPCSSGSARRGVGQGRHRRQPGHAGGLRLPPRRSRPTRRPRGPRSPGARRSGFPDAHRALPGGRPPRSTARWSSGGDGRSASTSIILVDDEVAGQPLGAGPLPHGGAPEIEHPIRHAWRTRPRALPGWQADARARPAPHRRSRDHGRAASRRPRGGAPDQPGRHPPSARAGASGCRIST